MGDEQKAVTVRALDVSMLIKHIYKPFTAPYVVVEAAFRVYMPGTSAFYSYTRSAEADTEAMARAIVLGKCCEVME